MAGVNVNFKTGEKEILKLANQVVSKKTGELVPAFKTYVEINRKLYKIEITDCKKDTKSGNPAMWVKITEKKPRSQGGGGFGGQQNGFARGF